MPPLISIIIPVYNTEKYLKKCVNSVIGQTHVNLEIILINDGSTDNSGKICDGFARQDNRIRVIHKENGGQGTARNMAIDTSRGEYISFLDSDDYLDNDFIDTLYKALVKYNADIGMCCYRDIDEDGKVLKKKKIKIKGPKIYTSGEALEVMLYWKEFGVAPWSKLYKASLWKNIRFREDIIYEDLATTYKVMDMANKVAFLPDIKMSYRHRRNSDIRQPFNRKKLSVLDTSEEILEFVNEKYPYLYKAAISRKVSSAFFILLRLPEGNSEYAKMERRLERIIKECRTIVIFDRKARRKVRIGSALTFFGFFWVKKIFWILKRKNENF